MSSQSEQSLCVATLLSIQHKELQIASTTHLEGRLPAWLVIPLNLNAALTKTEVSYITPREKPLCAQACREVQGGHNMS